MKKVDLIFLYPFSSLEHFYTTTYFQALKNLSKKFSKIYFINSSNLTDHAKAISLMKIFLKIPGLNLPKAGFVCQLVAGLVGCMDIHNIKTYGVDAKSLEYNKNCTTSRGIDNNRKKLIKYINLCHDYGTENLWNSWCSLIADKYPRDFVDGNHVSELHYTYLTGEYND